MEPERQLETAAAPPRRGCLLVGLAAAVGALAGAIVAGLIVLVVLSGDGGGRSGGDDVADAGSVADAGAETSSGEDREAAVVATDAPVEVTLPEGSTGDADFWSQVLAESNLFSGVTSGEPDVSSGDSTADLDPDLLADVWARMLTGESNEPGAPLGSRIEGINIKAVLEAVQESVVIVKTPTAENPYRGGSGFVVGTDGHIVTNEHVVRDAETVEVRLFGGELLPAEVVAGDPTRDLAVLKIDRVGLPAVRLGSTEGVEVGDEVIAIGNAIGIVGEPTVTRGIVSGLDRALDVDGKRLVGLIQTDAAINPGNSGGPLVNAAGEVIGVNTAIAGGFVEGIGFAISTDGTMPVINAMLEGTVIRKALLGITMVPIEAVRNSALADERFAGISIPADVEFGVAIVEVVTGSSAADAGLQRGDIIVAFGSREIVAPQDLADAVLATLPGTRVELRVVSPPGPERTVEVELGAVDDATVR
ncbi:S1C family serine protease [Candidatus Poriferisodalis sp.]|uniref:S1C family serine protease n=1 Tax=Candidatus Poriferisodalis sp. TaxID=3101277 RepID=UPI003B019FC5